MDEYIPVPTSPLAATYAYSYSEITGIPWDYIDITSTGTLLITADDDGTPVTLGAPFRFYGEEYSVLAATTNGYLSTLSTDDGPDLSNDCPLPSPPSTGGGDRIYPYHDDLITSVYYQYFSTCPISNPRTGSSMGASVFQWVGTHYGSAIPVNVEAILYNNGDIAFYTSATGDEYGSGATFGIQNASATEGLTLSCNSDLGTDQIAYFISGGASTVPINIWWIAGLFVLLAVGIIIKKIFF
ncbi:MAG: hypothetical protein K9H26_07920 [Prolixibacteraceae bacterium]|nr:hypothetical protein [Prolixibacteraceae bacterium]